MHHTALFPAMLIVTAAALPQGAAGVTPAPARGPDQAPMLAQAPAQAQQAILEAVRHIPASQEAHRRYRLALALGAPLFPADAQLALPPVPPELARWLALPSEQRRHDLLISPDANYFWNAEGRLYSAAFLLHLRPAEGGSGSGGSSGSNSGSGGGTAIDVLQLHPTIYTGKKFDLLGRTGPGFYQDLQAAPPSAQAEAELRAFIAAALAGPRTMPLQGQ